LTTTQIGDAPVPSEPDADPPPTETEELAVPPPEPMPTLAPLGEAEDVPLSRPVPVADGLSAATTRQGLPLTTTVLPIGAEATDTLLEPLLPVAIAALSARAAGAAAVKMSAATAATATTWVEKCMMTAPSLV
jgi:hypothetical protein